MKLHFFLILEHCAYVWRCRRQIGNSDHCRLPTTATAWLQKRQILRQFLAQNWPKKLVISKKFNIKTVLYFFLQSNEEGIRQCLQVLAGMASRDMSHLESYKIANIQHNIQNVYHRNAFYQDYYNIFQIQIIFFCLVILETIFQPCCSINGCSTWEGFKIKKCF